MRLEVILELLLANRNEAKEMICVGYFRKLLKINKIKEPMLDEESNLLFDAKIDYMITRNIDQFYSVIDNLKKMVL